MSSTTIEPEFITYADAARLLSVSVDTIERRIQAKALQRYDIDNPGAARAARRVRRSDVLRLARPVDPDGLTSAVADAARNASLYGEAQTARLANELVGALQNFLPDSEGKASALVRIKKSVGPMVSAFSTGVAAQLAANPATMRAIESGAQVIAQAVK